MSKEDKLAKLQRLKILRFRLSLGVLAYARADETQQQRAHEAAQRDYEEVRDCARQNTRKALFDAQSIRDSAARFAGIAITVRQERDKIEVALDEVEDTAEKIVAAQRQVAESRFAHQACSVDERKFGSIMTRFRNIRQAAEIAAEEDEIAELFSMKRKDF